MNTETPTADDYLESEGAKLQAKILESLENMQGDLKTIDISKLKDKPDFAGNFDMLKRIADNMVMSSLVIKIMAIVGNKEEA